MDIDAWFKRTADRLTVLEQTAAAGMGRAVSAAGGAVTQRLEALEERLTALEGTTMARLDQLEAKIPGSAPADPTTQGTSSEVPEASAEPASGSSPTPPVAS